ncbi:MAG: S8 family serine peptidase, partial [Thermoplasmata archaeon]|nr:S8 family serine peptidase [Thermoplasmata archaeon]
EKPVFLNKAVFSDEGSLAKYSKSSNPNFGLWQGSSLVNCADYSDGKVIFNLEGLPITGETTFILRFNLDEDFVREFEGESINLRLSRIDSNAGVSITGEGISGYIDSPASGIRIDGLFDDWENTQKDVIGDTANPNVDITNYDSCQEEENAYFYLKVKGEILAGVRVPATRAMNEVSTSDTDDHGSEGSTDITLDDTPLPVETGEDTIYIFLDTNSEVPFGYKAREGFYANVMMEIKGEDGKITSSRLMEFVGDDVEKWDWKFVKNVGAASGEMEIEAGVDGLSDDFRVLFNVVSWDEEEDYSSQLRNNFFPIANDNPPNRDDYTLEEFVKDEIIVGYSEEVSLSNLSQTIEENGGKIKKHNTRRNSILVKINPERREEFVDEIKNKKGIQYVEPNYYVYASMTPNDTYYSYQWGVDNIDCPKAWDSTTGDDSVVIAIVDTGVDYNHEDLKNNMWESSNGSHGWDFVNDDKYPMDDNNHGTHCAGIAAAEINNGKGIAGVAQVKIMAVKVLNESGKGNVYDIADGIEFAADQGADIISLSLGGSSSSVEKNACELPPPKWGWRHIGFRYRMIPMSFD